RTTPTPTSPTDRPSWAVPVEDLGAMLATDDDTVGTAAIPCLAFRDALEEPATTSDAPASAVAESTAARSSGTPVARPAAPPAGHTLRRRRASPQSRVAVRRNLVAVACVIVTVVLLGAAAGWIGGWVAVSAYALLVLGAAAAVRRANARYVPRHSRYTPRHA